MVFDLFDQSGLPDAKLVRDAWALRTDLEKILTFIKTPAKGLDLPLDIRGTPFQRRVWAALLGVRVGYKITYAALASQADHKCTLTYCPFCSLQNASNLSRSLFLSCECL
jgi:O6-methylguanine-DNA--protein-cysteine methyltransferase